MAILLIRYRLFEKSAPARLEGGVRSPAAALDSALSKVPTWLLDVCGYDSSGTPFARRIFRRINPERKRPGPVEILVNENILPVEQLVIRENNETLSDFASLLSLLERIVSKESQSGSELLKPAVSTASERGNFSANLRANTGSKDQATRSRGDTSVVIADSDLVVINCITIAWQLDAILGKLGVTCRRVVWNWSDNLLEAVHEGLVDLAIYNTASTERFIEDNKSENIHILNEWGKSMGGRNFYVLARKDSSWHSTGLPFFLERLKKGATIIVPERSDMINNLLAVLDHSVSPLTSMGVKIVPVPVSQGIEALDVNPEAVLIHGQNVRFKARFRGRYHEVLNYETLPERLQMVLMSNSSNSLIASERLMSSYPRDTLLAAIEAARQQFFSSWTNDLMYASLVKEIVSNQRKYGSINEDEMNYVVKQVLYETYRFGASEGHHVLEM
jgi:hypothetical protein